MRIGISSCFFHADPKRPIFKGKTLLYVEQSLAHYVMSEGALAYLIPSAPLGARVGFKELIEELDGLVLQGGSDVAPESYGEKPLRPEWGGDRVRDIYEMELVKEFMRVEKPILGICRGAQLINVALGGTLYQDIATQIPNALNHRDWDIYDQNFHEIQFVPETELARRYSSVRTAKVNTIHHQALKDLGSGLKVEAHSVPDGLVEAVRWEGDSYVAAVQWHPEFHDPTDLTLLDGRVLLREFMDEVIERKK